MYCVLPHVSIFFVNIHDLHVSRFSVECDRVGFLPPKTCFSHDNVKNWYKQSKADRNLTNGIKWLKPLRS